MLQTKLFVHYVILLIFCTQITFVILLALLFIMEILLLNLVNLVKLTVRLVVWMLQIRLYALIAILTIFCILITLVNQNALIFIILTFQIKHVNNAHLIVKYVLSTLEMFYALYVILHIFFMLITPALQLVLPFIIIQITQLKIVKLAQQIVKYAHWMFQIKFYALNATIIFIFILIIHVKHAI